MTTRSDIPERPALRPLEVRRLRDDGPGGQPGIVLQDRLGISEPAFVPEPLLPIVGRCDGTRSLAQIHKQAARQFGGDLPLQVVQEVVRHLDERLLLRGERADRAAAAAAGAFLGGPARPARHAGSAGCPRDPALLREALRALVQPPAAAGPPTPLRGLIAPHIDVQRGAAGYAAAYSRLAAAAPADLYVVFGTGHAGPSAPVTGLPLDWDTPLGRVGTDRGFVAAVHRAIGEPSPTDLLHHRDEHSLEFQMLFLQHLHARHFAGLPFAVAGFLCGALPSASGDPLQEEYCQRLLAAFRAAAAASGKRICWLAGADLAHIGPFFGDAEPVGDERLRTLAAAEHARLEHLRQGRPGAFHAAVDRAANPDRVCSAPAITLCAALAGGPGELLHYGQARADDGAQAVAFCAMAFRGLC